MRELLELIRGLIRSALKRTNTCMPGIVVSFNRTLRTADVQPAPKRKLVGKSWQDMKVIRNCPVSYPAGGGFGMTWDLVPGDAVMLVFAQRNLFRWTGGSVETYEPNDTRMHDLNDAWVIPAGPPASVALEAAANKLIIATADGATKVTLDKATGAVDVITDGAVTVDAGTTATMYGATETRLGSAAPANYVALANLVLAELNKIQVWAAAHTHVCAAPGAPSAVAVPVLAPPAAVAATKTKAT